MIYVLGGGAGGELIIHAPAGVTVIAVNNGTGKTYSKVADASGMAVFKGLPEETYTVHITDGQQSTDPIQVAVAYKSSAAITWFQVRLTVTWPAGSTCRCTLGSTVLTAPNTSGSHTFTITTPGTWTISCSNEYLSASATANLATSGARSVTLSYRKELLANGNTLIGLPQNSFPSAYWSSDAVGGDEPHVVTGNTYAGTGGQGLSDHPIYFSTKGYSTLTFAVGITNGWVLVELRDNDANENLLASIKFTDSGYKSMDISNININNALIRYHYLRTDRSPTFDLHRIRIE